MSWYLLKAKSLRLEVREDLEKIGFEYFLPTFFEMMNVATKRIRKERPLVLNYLFVNGLLDDIREFCHVMAEYHLHVVYLKKSQNGDTPSEPLIIPDAEMQMFIRTVGAYSDRQVPYLKPTEVSLEQGDHVRIIGGQFDGIEGVLISQQGCDGGKVMVSVSNILTVPTLHIEPQYLQILRFGKDKKHLYKHIDSYVPRLRKAIEEPIPSNLIPIKVFVNRFRQLQTDTPNAEAKILSLLIASFRLLGLEEEAASCRERLGEIMQFNSSEKTKIFVEEFVRDIEVHIVSRSALKARQRADKKSQGAAEYMRRSRRLEALKKSLDEKHKAEAVTASDVDQEEVQDQNSASGCSQGERTRLKDN